MSDEKREMPSRIIPDMKYEELLNRMRIYEDAILGIQKTVHAIDEDYQLAKHKNRIACMCCPFLRKSEKRKGS